MNNETIVGDIHLGKPFPFTTTKTAARWAQYKKNHLKKIVDRYGPNIIQAGDLFDSFSCNSETFVEGYMLLQLVGSSFLVTTMCPTTLKKNPQ